MTNKEVFIKAIEEVLDSCPDFFGQDEKADKAMQYFNQLKNEQETKGGITENGQKILDFFADKSTDDFYSAKEIGEALFLSGRSISGSMRKLIADGYIEKTGQNPVKYHFIGKTESN